MLLVEPMDGAGMVVAEAIKCIIWTTSSIVRKFVRRDANEDYESEEFLTVLWLSTLFKQRFPIYFIETLTNIRSLTNPDKNDSQGLHDG